MLTASPEPPRDGVNETGETCQRRLESLARTLRLQQRILQQQAASIHRLWMESGFPEASPRPATRSPLFDAEIKIVGGDPSKGRFPESCAILARGKEAATGVILHDRLVLTASHVATGADLIAAYPVDIVGLVDCSHPVFRCSLRKVETFVSGSDGLTLLEILDPGAPSVTPARLGSRADFEATLERGGTMVGFGVEFYSSTLFVGEKRISTQPIQPLADPPPGVDETQFVVPGELHRVCTGDSGGPFYLGSGEGPVLVGVASHSLGAPVCEQDSVYIRVDLFAERIREAATKLGVTLA